MDTPVPSHWHSQRFTCEKSFHPNYFFFIKLTFFCGQKPNNVAVRYVYTLNSKILLVTPCLFTKYEKYLGSGAIFQMSNCLGWFSFWIIISGILGAFFFRIFLIIRLCLPFFDPSSSYMLNCKITFFHTDDISITIKTCNNPSSC